ncbi:MAG: sensor histidine kinase [Planctomycetota bacterium]
MKPNKEHSESMSFLRSRLALIIIFTALSVSIVILFIRDIPSRIDDGDKGRIAIKTLDEVRRPFLDVHNVHSTLLNDGYSKAVRASLERGIAHGKSLIADFKTVATYNPELLQRVEQLANAFETWIKMERVMFDRAAKISSTNTGFQDDDKYYHLITKLSRGFSLTMSLLGDAEIPIHKDIHAGSQAINEILIIGGIMLVGLTSIVFFLQWSKYKRLSKLLAEVKRYGTEHKKAEEKLIEKSKEIERTNKELEGFIYTISHDLKEPLFAIEGHTSKLFKTYKDTFDDKGELQVSRIQANIKELFQRINDIMDVMKTGKVAYNFKNNDSGAVARDTVKTLEDRIKSNNINAIIQDNLPTVLCDKEKLKTVFSNLVTNSIKFMGNDKQRQIKIVYDKYGDYYKFSVEDTGIGIPVDHQSQIFKIFQRLKALDTEGTGVGLAIVEKIIDVHKGTVWVESPVKDERGTRFCFTIPI